jgi:hypothetical protein
MATAKELFSKWKPDPAACVNVFHVSDKHVTMRRSEIGREKRVYLARRVIAMQTSDGLAGVTRFLKIMEAKHGEAAVNRLRADIAREQGLFPSKLISHLNQRSDRPSMQPDILEEIDPEANAKGLAQLKAMMGRAANRHKAEVASDSKPASQVDAPTKAPTPGFVFTVNTSMKRASTRAASSVTMAIPDIEIQEIEPPSFAPLSISY